MDKSRLEIKVGLFVCRLPRVLLAAMMVQFNKGASLLNDTYILKAPHRQRRRPQANEAAVLLAGVKVGAVKDIELADGRPERDDLPEDL